MKSRILCLFLIASSIYGQLVTYHPTYPTINDSIVIIFDASLGNSGLKDYYGDVYAHTGLITNASSSQSDWKNVIAKWEENIPKAKLSKEPEPNKYRFVIRPNVKDFYNLLSSDKALKVALVFRSADRTREGKDVGNKDIFIPLYSAGISVILNTPTVNRSFGDPSRSPVFINEGGSVPISATTSELGTKTKAITLFVNGVQKFASSSNTLSYTFLASDYTSSKNEIKIVAADTSNQKDSTGFVIIKNPAIKNIALPAGNKIGINYNSSSQVTLALYAPQKNFVYVISDLSDWKVEEKYFMNRYEAKPDSVIWWLSISNLEAGKEIAYQYLIDGELRLGDPYTDKVLDNSNDKNIPSLIYPNLIPYPSGKTENLVSVFQPGQAEFDWKVKNFKKPSKERLVIYEMLVRDFVGTHSFKSLKDTLSYFKKLGINAIEVMPFNEFEGNSSWGYNPSFYFAPDKYYGTKNDLKSFIDACHQNGIAVIMDIVLNHAYGQNSMVKMYWNNSAGKPAANNPWFNQQSNFANPDAQWGYDFNHESYATQYFVDRMLQYWITEYKIDGFRFDFTKGIGNNPKPATGDNWGSNYDPDRIRLLKRMVSKVWSYDPTSIMIFEHLAVNTEETELANYGILLWGNMNSAYNEATMGYNENYKSNLDWISYKSRGWNNPNLVGYMESHDEERLVYKNMQYGNSSGSYNTKTLETALDRIKLAGSFFFTIPGPKMIWQFGELGYDRSINEGGRLGQKPLPWSDGLNYYSNADRQKLLKVFSALIKLKKNYPAFSSSTFTLDATGAVKSLTINHFSMDVVIFGNFDVVNRSTTFSSKSISKWYEFFTGDSINVSDVATTINLLPGEYRLYTSKKLPSFEVMTDIKKESEDEIPVKFNLEQNFPNPFNPSTEIRFSVPKSGHVTLKVFDSLGREVATLVNEFKQAGNYNSSFALKNSSSASGVYFYQVRVGSFVETKKMILMK